MSKKKIGPLKRKAKSLIKKEIQKQEKAQRRRLTPNEQKEIKEQVLDKMRKTIARVGIIGVIGLSRTNWSWTDMHLAQVQIK